jgi:hypothetical protein
MRLGAVAPLRGALNYLVAVLFTVAVFHLSSPPAFAAGGVYGNLTGIVLDAATHAPIAGASIVAKSGSGTYHATTNASGRFTILGMSVDTYTVTVSAPKHQTIDVPGVVVFGDETDTIGTVSLQAQLITIARVTSRSVSSVYQPSQTTDSYTVNQAQIQQSTGNAASTNENAALLAVPGVTLTNALANNTLAGSVTIRGGAAAEVGYQYDGVPFKEPFLGQNGSIGLMTGVGEIQVVEGAGDATQGEVGAGVINVIPQRGSGWPGTGLLDLEMGAPNFSHKAGFDYGFAAPNGRISNYIAYNGDRSVPYYGYHATPLDQYGNYFATQYFKNDLFTDNFFYKFGHNLGQQVQLLFTTISQEGYGTKGPGGVYTGTLLFDPSTGIWDTYSPGSNPNALAYYPYDALTQQLWMELAGYSPSQYASLIGLGPGVPTKNLAITNPQQNFSNTTNFLKFEYDNNLSSSTYVALRYYNWTELQNSDDQFTNGPWQSGAPGLSFWAQTGGQTVGTNLDIVHQIGSNMTVTLNGQYNVLYPEFTLYEPQLSIIGMLGTGLTNQPSSTDWMPPCSALTSGIACTPGGGYIYDYFCGTTPWTSGAPPSCLPRIPSWGINYNKSTFQNWGTGVRIQYDLGERVKLDFGVRDEGQIRHWFSQLDALGQGVPTTGYLVSSCAAFAANPANYLQCPTAKITNPFDVPSNLWLTEPTVVQPRGSISWQISRNDSLRFAYGRSAVFSDAQTGGTPFEMWGLNTFAKVPAKTAPGIPTLCGWNSAAFNAAVFPCSTYAQQLYWMGDNLEAPDAENLPPAVYSNYDLSYSHLFKSGWGVRVTPFFKEGTSLPTFYLLNPVLGIFAISNKGFNKTTGIEFGVTTPQQPLGLSGFFSATYQNVLSSTPPFTVAETAVPLNTLATLELGDIYRAGYVSPFSIRVGAVENFRDGLSISPQLEYNIGYPYSVGNMIASCIAFNADGTCAHYANVPQVDFGAGITSGQSSLVGSSPGSSISTNYYDPAYPGSNLNPNIAATRGTPATAANGGILSHANLTADLTVQWKHQGNTIGVQMFNLFGNAWVNSVPAINPWYQPVANGLSGPQTGYNSCVNQTGTARGCYPEIPKDSYAFTNGAYLLSNGNFTGVPQFGPLYPFTVQVFYQRQL